MSTLFIQFYEFFRRRKGLFGIVLTGVLVAAALLGLRLSFEEDISKIMPADTQVSDINKLFENTDFNERLVMTLSFTDTSYYPENPEALISLCDALVDSLEKALDSTMVRQITYKIDEQQFQEVYDILYKNLPLFLEEEDYRQIAEQTASEAIEPEIEGAFRTLMTPGGSFLKKYLLRDPLSITRLAMGRLQSFQIDDNFNIYNGYVVTKDYRNLLVFITPRQSARETLINKRLLKTLDGVTAAITGRFENKMTTDYFGAIAVAVGNATQIRRDVTATVAVAMLALLLIIGYFFRRPGVFFFIVLPILFGAAAALASLSLLKGKVSIISVGIGSMLLGITVDYSLHVFTHYRNTGDMRRVIKDLALPLLLSSMTTAGAFLCLYWVRSSALHDLGLFAALSVGWTAFFTLFILPTAIGGKATQTEPRKTILDRIATYSWEGNRYLLLFIAVFSIIAIFKAWHVEFENDLNKVNFMSEKVRAAEKRLNSITSVTMRGVYLVSGGKNLAEALQYSEEVAQVADSLKQAGIIKGYTSANSLLLTASAQQQKIDRWNAFWTPQKKQQLIKDITQAAGKLQFREDAFDDFFTHLDRDFIPQPPAAFSLLADLFLNDYIAEHDTIATVLTLLRLDQASKAAVYNTFQHRKHVNIMDKEYLIEKFVEILRKDFNGLVLISLLLVFAILHFSYGRIELAMISFVPLLLSWFWTLALMHLFGLKFNIINVIITTFIFGVGIDYSIFVMRGLMQRYKYGEENMDSYKTSVFLSALTTIVGIGVMIFAKHPALQSIAGLSVIGISSTLLITFSVQPLLFRWLIYDKKGRQREYPRTLANTFKTLFVYLMLFLGSLVVTVAGILLLLVFFIGTERRKYALHWLIWQFSRFYIWLSFLPDKVWINPNGEDFSKPAIIISNHQSHIDTPVLFSLAPKLIILTKGWVYNFPLYHLACRMADFFSVEKGLEVLLPDLEKRKAHGYHIAIFPEGSRSATEAVNRFHKGAFYLAEQLQMDILPIYIHGTGRFLRKESFWGESNDITIKVGDRIAPDDPRFGTDYTTRTKSICTFYRKEYDAFQQSCKTPRYYRRALIENYIYKGPLLEWYTRIKLKLEDYYTVFDNLIPQQGRITDLGCGYGYLDLMLSYRAPQRRITGVDYDEEKISVANHCNSSDRALQFIAADITEYQPEPSDVFILADVLHYLTPEKQTAVLEKCYNQLHSKGLIIVRDGDSDLQRRHRGTRLTEVFSTRIGFNKTTNPLNYLSGGALESWAKSKGMTIQRVDLTRRTSNIIFVMQKAPHNQ